MQTENKTEKMLKDILNVICKIETRVRMAEKYINTLHNQSLKNKSSIELPNIEEIQNETIKFMEKSFPYLIISSKE